MKKKQHIDAAYDVAINAVRMPDGRVVSWAEAFPRVETPVHVEMVDHYYDER